MIDYSIRAIAARFRRALSTVSREIESMVGELAIGPTRPTCAAWNRGYHPKLCKLAENRALAYVVTDKLRLLWSPEQIATWPKHNCHGHEIFKLSHEFIAAFDGGGSGVLPFASLWVMCKGTGVPGGLASTMGGTASARPKPQESSRWHRRGRHRRHRCLASEGRTARSS